MKITVLYPQNKWAVKFQPVVKDDEGNSVAGLTDFARKTMFIATKYPETMKDKEIKYQISCTYWHEVAHSIFYSAETFTDLSFWNIDVEHIVIAPLARSLALLMPIEIEIDRG